MSVCVVPVGVPSSSGEALGMVLAGLGWLAGADLASDPVVVQAGALRGLEDAESLLTAARAGVLSAFERCRGFEDDGQGTARTWLRWQTRVSNGAASGSVGWMRRLRAHRLVAEVLAGAGISASWARQVCDWTELLPAGYRDEADGILLRAVADGADLKDLAVIAEELRDKLAEPDGDGPGGAGPGSGGDGLGGLGRPDGSDPLRDGRVWFGHGLVPEVRLGDQQVGAGRQADEGIGPGGIAGVGDDLAAGQRQAQGESRSAAGMVDFQGRCLYPGRRSDRRAGGTRRPRGARRDRDRIA